MDTKLRPASGARPPGFFSFNKTRQPAQFNASEVFNHAHAVFGVIPLIQRGKSLARKAGAADAEVGTSPDSQFAAFDSARDAGFWFAALIPSAARAFVPGPQECATKPAIHPTRRQEQDFMRALVAVRFRHFLVSSYGFKQGGPP